MQHCTIAELGFGTGLNFLETIRQWKRFRLPGASLHYTAFEAYPMSREDLERSLSRWPDLADAAARLVAIWPMGGDALEAEFAERARLTIHFADANAALPALQFEADAWYLDGFAPSRNPQMWGGELLKSVFEPHSPVRHLRDLHLRGLGPQKSCGCGI